MWNILDELFTSKWRKFGVVSASRVSTIVDDASFRPLLKCKSREISAQRLDGVNGCVWDSKKQTQVAFTFFLFAFQSTKAHDNPQCKLRKQVLRHRRRQQTKDLVKITFNDHSSYESWTVERGSKIYGMAIREKVTKLRYEDGVSQISVKTETKINWKMEKKIFLEMESKKQKNSFLIKNRSECWLIMTTFLTLTFPCDFGWSV